MFSVKWYQSLEFRQFNQRGALLPLSVGEESCIGSEFENEVVSVLCPIKLHVLHVFDMPLK